jgi:hypothetical protein
MFLLVNHLNKSKKIFLSYNIYRFDNVDLNHIRFYRIFVLLNIIRWIIQTGQSCKK